MSEAKRAIYEPILDKIMEDEKAKKILEFKRKILLDAGWSLWYNPDYWVHQKVVQNPEVQDYTNYGMSLELAYLFEMNGMSVNSMSILQRT